MMTRAYTVTEIDEIRRLCENKYLFGFYRFPENWQGGWSHSYNEADKIKAVEEMTRTFLLAGVAPADLR